MKAQVDNEVETRIGQELELRRETAKLRGQQTPQGQFFEEQEVSRSRQREAQLSDDAKLSSGQWSGDVWREKFRDRQRDFFNQREGLKQAFKIEFEDKEPSNKVDAAIDAYFDVDIDSYLQPDGATDWDSFFAARDSALASLSSREKMWVMEFIHKFDTPTVMEFRKAQDLRSELEDSIPRVVGLKVEEYSELREWLRERVAAARRSWLEKNAVNVPLEDAVRTMAERDNKGPNFTQWALLLRGGIPDELRNPRFDAFLIENEATLRRFFPELYESQRILEQLAGVK